MQRKMDIAASTASNVQSNTAANNASRNQTNIMVQVRDIFFLCLAQWKWFVLSLVITLGYAFWYLKSTPKVYTCTASILLKQNDNSSSSAERQLQEMGVDDASPSLTNEMLLLTSSPLSKEVVNRLNLDVNYYHNGVLKDEVAYGLNLPVTVTFSGLDDSETASFHLSLHADGQCEVSNMSRNGKTYDQTLTTKLGNVAKLPIGNVLIAPSEFYSKGIGDELEVVRISKNSAVNRVRGGLSVEVQVKNSSVLDIRYRDQSIDRANDVLNTLIVVYNEAWINDRNRMTLSTNDFIKERLSVIENELGHFDQTISNYKSRNLMPDVEALGSQAMTQSTAATQESHQLGNQIYMARYIRANLLDERHNNQLLPSNSGIGNTSIQSQIGEYNDMLLKRNKYVANSSEQNPIVMDLDANLSVMRRAIIHTLDNEIALLEAQQVSAQSNKAEANAKIAANPKQAQFLISEERQQKVKETLYLFLLQKREENEMSQAFTAYNTKVVEPAHVGGGATTPVDSNVMMIAFLVGLLVPAGVVVLREVVNTTVRSRKELETLNVPFVGEIPLSGSPEKFSILRRSKQKHHGHKVVVEEGSRNLINEAFRIVRSNLEFLVSSEGRRQVIMLTSMYPGSGKTFISHNLALTMAVNGKKTIVIDLDMRHGSLSQYFHSPKLGVSNYLGAQTDDYRSLIISEGNIDILPCGTIPPNPTELLYSPRFEALINNLRKEYDYIFIDCPPSDMVADVSIITPHTDVTLFVIRVGLFDRSLLPTVEQWYESGKFKNLAILLNGSTSYSAYGSHRYGYYGHYGYYGKGYYSGYYTNDEKNNDETNV